jgi:hypothetical protein
MRLSTVNHTKWFTWTPRSVTWLNVRRMNVHGFRVQYHSKEPPNGRFQVVQRLTCAMARISMTYVNVKDDLTQPYPISLLIDISIPFS